MIKQTFHVSGAYTVLSIYPWFNVRGAAKGGAGGAAAPTDFGRSEGAL